MHNRINNHIANHQIWPLSTQRIVLTGTLLISSFLLSLPIHFFGLGYWFLPIQLPLLLGAFLLPLGYALFLVVAIPIMNNLLIGMPGLFPMLPAMAGEFLTYVLIIKSFSNKKYLNTIATLITAQICGRLISALLKFSFCHFAGLHFVGLLPYIKHLFVDFYPGITVQIITVPLLVYLLKNKV